MMCVARSIALVLGYISLTISTGFAADEPSWMVSVGSVFLDRSRPDPNRMVSAYLQTNVISSGSDFDIDMATGPDVSLARRLSCGDSVEVRYFSAFDADSAFDYGNAGPIQIGRFGLTNALGLTAEYESTLHSTEINWWRPISDRFTWLTGFRWIEFDDAIHFHVTRPSVFVQNDLYWDQKNQLYGGQIGGSLDWLRKESSLSIKSTMKAGIYGNTADNDFTFFQSGPGGGVIPGGADGSRIAFAGEIDLLGIYQINRHISLRSGYQLLWLESVAVASDQAGIATNLMWDRQIDINGGVFYHGVQAGIDFTW